MANGYTEHYGLCQWAAEDSFLREEFNQDNAKIDRALHQAFRRGSRADYHLCNLLLQNDYEGKYTGFKRALLFDGFLDGEGIASRTGFHLGQNALTLSSVGQSSITLPEGPGSATPLSTPQLTMTGCGRITGFQYYLYADINLSGQGELRYVLTVNGETRSSGATYPDVPPKDVKEARTLTLPEPVEVCPEDVCVLRLEAHTSGLRMKKGENDTLCGVMQIQPAGAESGSMTARAVDLPEAAGAAGWVRCRGGVPGLALRKGDQTLTFAAGQAISAKEPLEGTACTETPFTLDAALEAGSWQVVLTGALAEGENRLDVFDYGVVLY